MLGKVLIVGTGFFGEKLFNVLESSGVEVEGTLLEKSRGFSKLDITDEDNVTDFLADSFPETVVLTAAVSNVDYCEQHKENAFLVNVDGAKNVARACLANSAKLVFLSTDYVFDGARGNYEETDAPNPIQYYGETKLLAERAISEITENSLIMRVSSLFGHNSLDDKACFPKFVIGQLKQGKQLNATMQITNPTLIDDAANALVKLVEANENGVFHVVGATSATRFDVALETARLFGLDASLIKESSDLHFAAKRPQNSSLSTKKINSLGIEMHSLSEGLQLMKKQMEE